MQSAVDRWQELVDARALQTDAAYARLGRTSADFWDRRARGYHRAMQSTIANDQLLLKLRREVTSQTTILDVGAGTGRFALALAPQAKHITAIEPNASMLSYLRQDADKQGLTNLSYVPTTWQDAPDDLHADIVICSHVLYPIRDIVPFLTKIRAATHRTCFLYVWAIPSPLDLIATQFWQHFHGDERCLAPRYIHALDVLYEMGIYTNVEIVNQQLGHRYSSLDSAVEELLEQLILPDDHKTRAELRQLLEGWLVERDGIFMAPVDGLVSAIIQMTL